MSDTASLSLVLDKSDYAVGETMTATVSGTVVSGPTSATVAIAAVVRASDGAQFSTNVVNATVTTPGGQPLSYAIKSITDLSGRVWTVGADGVTATAIA